MREILFRGKAINQFGILKQEEGWVFGTPVPILINAHMKDRIEIVRCHGYDEFDHYQLLSEDEEVDPKTVGQYTGLKDKNGKMIFEGDILGSRYGDLYPDNVTVEVVKWFCNGWAIQQEDCPPSSLTENDILPYSEVIGNIYDNPDLLKGGNEGMTIEKAIEILDIERIHCGRKVVCTYVGTV